MKNQQLLWMVGVCAVALLGGCKRFPNPFANQKLLAEVGKERLYEHDLAAIYTSDMNAEDSLKMKRSYVDQWVRKQLKIREAEELFKSSAEDIDRMVEEYRNSLMTYKVDQFYVDKQLDTLFTEGQLANYYLEHMPDFILDKTLLKACVVKMPEEAREKNKIREMMLATEKSVDAYQDFVDICTKNGFELTELNTWTEFPTLLSLLPTDQQKDYDYLLDGGKVHEFRAGKELWLMRVTSLRKAGDYAPLESVTDVIKRVLFNQRKQDIIRYHEDSLYRKAIADKKIIVNVN